MSDGKLQVRGGDMDARVKPLVWEEPCERNNYCHIARTMLGDYYVHIDGGRHQAFLEAHVKPFENLIGKEVGDIWAAKVAAQADYEARILAALEPAPDLALDVLSGLSSYLGAGIGDDSTTAAEYDKRIRWGIDHQISATVHRCAAVVEELSKDAYSGQPVQWGQIKAAVLAVSPAPDLAELVEAAKRYDAANDAYDEGNDDAMNEWRAARLALKAAIAKIEEPQHG